MVVADHTGGVSKLNIRTQDKSGEVEVIATNDVPYADASQDYVKASSELWETIAATAIA